MKIFAGAYAASPCHTAWDPKAEAEYLTGLAEDERISGLELPFFGRLHRHDSDWLLKNLPSHWDHVLTCIPGTMEQLSKQEKFGLASVDTDGRKASLAFLRHALEAVHALNHKLGRAAVQGIEVHSAPTLGKVGVASSMEHFAESLSEVLQWDWQGATIFVEHCDRFIAEQAPAKGFLSIEEEIQALKAVPKNKASQAMLLINWGRSAIEGRSAKTPRDHVMRAARENLLGGIIFSGAAVDDPLYGNWADTHAPFGPPSLMTREAVIDCLRAYPENIEPLLGFKIQALPKTLSVEDRVERVRDWAAFLVDCARTARI